jgi:hypothetical protein
VKPAVSFGAYPPLAKLTTEPELVLDQPDSVYPALVETGAVAMDPPVSIVPSSTLDPPWASKTMVLEFAVHFA